MSGTFQQRPAREPENDPWEYHETHEGIEQGAPIPPGEGWTFVETLRFGTLHVTRWKRRIERDQNQKRSP